jgi:hypothetical protein
MKFSIPDPVKVSYTPGCFCTASLCLFDRDIKADDAVVIAVVHGQWNGMILHWQCALGEGIK